MNAKAMTLGERVENYAYQDLCTHRFIEKNCPTYLTPAQRRRMYKKENRARKLSNAPF